MSDETIKYFRESMKLADNLEKRISRLEHENERLLAELKTESTFEISPCAGCWSMENGCGPTVDCENCTVKIGKPSNWKASNQYD